MADTPTTPTNDLFVYNINNNYFWFSILLINLSSRAHIIKPSSIKKLVIEDTFQDFYHKGYIIINNTFDALEQNFVPGTASETIPGTNFTFSNINPSSNPANSLEGFILQGDSRDILQVNIMPCLNETNPKDFGNEAQQKLFRMTFDFAIYHTEDIEGENPNEKYKKLYFWDMYYELMREQNCYYSTSYYLNQTQDYSNPTDTSLINKTNTERGIPTGKALKSLLKEAFNDNTNGLGKYPVSFIEETSTSSTETSTDPNWDEGGTSLFFSAPARFKVIDSLNYILSRHVSTADKDFDQCFLRIERYPRVFTFRSLTNYFKNAYNDNETGGSYYLETIKIAGFSQTISQNDIFIPTFALDVVPDRGIYLDKYGTPKNINFSDMSGVFTQRELVSRLVHSYNYTDKAFQIDSEKNDIQVTYNTFQSNYVAPMKGGAGGAENVPNFTVGDMRYDRLNTETTFSVVEKEKDQRLASGRNKSFYAGIFANAVVTFRVPGSTHRQAGRFLGIDRDNALQNNIFDNKILGIYFILEVKHLFEDGEYFNEIKCVKTYYPTGELIKPSI